MRENEDLELFPFEVILANDIPTWHTSKNNEKDVGKLITRSPFIDDFRKIISTRKPSEYFKHRDSLYYLTDDAHQWFVNSDIVYFMFIGESDTNERSVMIAILGSDRATLFKMAWI